nr:MAG TPA: Protein of unknown function (DUF551) [Caudoviricetes sp.]
MSDKTAPCTVTHWMPLPEAREVNDGKENP